MKSKHANTNIIIVGGGLMGYTAALGLAKQGAQVTLLEAKPAQLDALPDTEGRAIALAYTSVVLYQRLGLWEALSPFATPIQTVKISQQGRFGKCHIHASELDVTSLGQVVGAVNLFRVLAEAVNTHPAITVRAPYTVKDIEQNEHQVTINHELSADILLACDGADSFVRQALNIDCVTTDYAQTAIVTDIHLSKPHQHIAHERFLANSVVALLPKQHHTMTSVVTLNSDDAKNLLTQPDNDFKASLQCMVGERVGEILTIGKRFDYPLKAHALAQTQLGRVVFLGNAAQTLSPLAAQGLNVGLRDLSVWLDHLLDACTSPQALEHKTTVLRLTDKLTRYAHHPLIQLSMSAGLFALNQSSLCKKALARELMGLSKHRGELMQEWS